MSKKNNFHKDILYLFVGEAVVAAIIVAVYLIIEQFSYKVLTGAVLGALVVSMNFYILNISVDKTINKYIKERGDSEMTDEEAAKFSSDHKMDVQNEMTKSYIFRSALMIGVLVLALITRQFDPIALLLPLVAYKPLIYVSEAIKGKRGE